MVLFRAFPRGDTKPLAKPLLARFGTFAESSVRRRNGCGRCHGAGARVMDELKLCGRPRCGSCAARS